MLDATEEALDEVAMAIDGLENPITLSSDAPPGEVAACIV
jgi:hypothetical protein